MASKRKPSNEQEVQGQLLVWINAEIGKRPGLGLDRATQEKPRLGSGKRSDLVVWADRASEVAFLATELKTPTTPINDPVLFADAIEKAQHWGAHYFAVWNMRDVELYLTPAAGEARTPADALYRSASATAISRVDDWLLVPVQKELQRQAAALLDAAHTHSLTGEVTGRTIDGEIFVTRLKDSITKLRGVIYRELTAQRSKKTLRKALNNIAAEQGFIGFVEDIDYAIAGQIGYRLIGQVLFYYALRRKQPSLKEITLGPKDAIPAALRPYWNDVRRFDYEALFKPDPIEDLVAIPAEGEKVVRQLIERFSFYEWASLTDDVLGTIFEHLIPREEQILLGQFYTPRPVADLLVAFTVDGDRPLVVDPGCGSGTFLMSAYSYIAHTARLSHKDLLSIIWGFDLSPFAAELAVINLYRQDMSEFQNFPRIVPGNFFDRQPGETVEFPAARVTSGGPAKVPVPIPKFDGIIGNPPYLRSQNQDDLDAGYRKQLFGAAAKAGVNAPAKTDLFAFFIYHALRFMKPGSRLGFVTPTSWLTADYAASLQEVLLGKVRVMAVITSSAESFFPQVDVNALLLVAERIEDAEEHEAETEIRFVTLKRPLASLLSNKGEYWNRVINLVDAIEAVAVSEETADMRVKVVQARAERTALAGEAGKARNWSKYLRAPLSYYELFEGGE
jgi:type I restriction enzyme M protein